MSLHLPESLMDRLRNLRRLVVLTGGGIAAESKIPSFTECHSGKWREYAMTDLATQQAYVRNPRLVWEWYAYRRALVETVEPGPSHYALVDLEQHYPHVTIITQTIDGLHWRAGSRNVVELNGCLRRSRCFESGHVLSDWEDVGEVPPRCPHCGSMLRPDVVLFGEGLAQSDVRAAHSAVEQCDVFLTVGDVGAIEPVASFPFIAKRSRAINVAIDPKESIYGIMADYVIAERPADALPALVAQITNTQ